MHALLYFLKKTYYVPALLLILGLVVIVVGYRKRKKFPYLKLLPVYAFISAAQIIATFISIACNMTAFRAFNNYSIMFFMVIELLIFYNLLLQIIESSYLKRSMNIMQFAFLLLSLFIGLTMDASGTISPIYYITNSTFLIIPCLFYFYEIFKAPPSIGLSTQPAFWVVIGFSFMIICSLPINLLEDYFFVHIKEFYEQICTLNYVFYCLVFILILKAFQCKPLIAK